MLEQNGNPILIYAFKKGDKEIVEVLLKKPNIDINMKDDNVILIFSKHMKKCYYILCVYENGSTALIYASQNGYKEIVEVLLKMPTIDINLKDKVINSYNIKFIFTLQQNTYKQHSMDTML